jgi:predicted O-methyltransferase YrrM
MRHYNKHYNTQQTAVTDMEHENEDAHETPENRDQEEATGELDGEAEALPDVPPTPEEQARSKLQERFDAIRSDGGDIHQHVQTLADLARSCGSVVELGVRHVVSSWAFLYGLCRSDLPLRRLLLVDINETDISEFAGTAALVGVNVEAAWTNDLDLDLEGQSFDMVFIDTWHVYAQLKRELAKYAPHARKFIVMHDTTVDAVHGESVRLGMNTREQAALTGFPEAEIRRGLWPAIDEFVKANGSEWRIRARYHNNNGLTILERIQ